MHVPARSTPFKRPVNKLLARRQVSVGGAHFGRRPSGTLDTLLEGVS